MDESSSDVDQLFKEAARGAGGLAHVLDPTKAIERGTKLRRFARRRRNALSGLVVLVAVVVFLVPLPQLHLFGPGGPKSTTSGHPNTSPLGSTAPTTAVTGIGPRGRDTGRLSADLVHSGQPRRVVDARDRSLSHGFRDLRRHRPHN